MACGDDEDCDTGSTCACSIWVTVDSPICMWHYVDLLNLPLQILMTNADNMNGNCTNTPCSFTCACNQGYSEYLYGCYYIRILSWTQSVMVERYTVSYTYIRRCGSDPMSGSEDISDGNARSFTLTDLEEDSDYTITLTAISAYGLQIMHLQPNFCYDILTQQVRMYVCIISSLESESFGTATLTSSG